MPPKVYNEIDITNYLNAAKGYDKVLQQVKIISAKSGVCKAEFTVTGEHLNFFGGLHGGFSATLVDCISTFALLSNENPVESAGVSVDLHVTYIKGAKLGDEIEIIGNTIKVGKTMAYLEASIMNKSTKDVLVKGLHTKYLPVKII